MSKDDHKIDADDRSVFDVLNERKFTVDYFQREYSWEQKHIEQLSNITTIITWGRLLSVVRTARKASLMVNNG